MAGLALAPGPGHVGVQAALALTALGLGSAVAFGAGRSVSPLWERVGLWSLVAAAFGVGAALAAHASNGPASLPPGGLAQLTAQVEDVRYRSPTEAWSRVRVSAGKRLVDGAAVPLGTLLLAGPSPLPDGAQVRLLANLQPGIAFRNPTPHPPLWAAEPSQGRARLAGPDAASTLEQSLFAGLLDRSRRALRQRLWQSLPQDVAPSACALLLGDPDSLSDDDEANVRGSGLAHVFAVSGMHVTLLAGLSVAGLRRSLLWIEPLAARIDSQRLAAGLGIPLALAIAAFTGGAPSGWRASITTAIAWLVVATGRRPDAAAVAAAACLVFGAVRPLDALRPAFLLSIAATAAILTATRRDEASLRGALLAAGSLTLRTSLATAPIVWWSFGSLPLVGLLANLLLVPVGSLLLLLTAAHAGLAFLVPALLPASGALLSIATRAFLHGCAALRAVDPAFSLPVPSLAQGIVLAASATLMLLANRTSTRVWAGLLGAVLWCGGEWQLRHSERPEQQLRATFLDVGQGDATLLDLPDGRVMLIDAGGNPQHGPDPGERVILPLLAVRRRERLDVVVLTHPHPDHYGGLAALLGKLPIGELWDSGQSAAEAELSGTSRQALDLVEAARARGTRVLRPEQLCDAPRDFGGARVEVLWPCPSFDAGFDPNDNSLVLRIAYAGRSLLFSGDIEGHAEAGLLARRSQLRADVLKVPHHGSRTSSSDAFLDAVSAKLAIVSAGAVNPFGHPHPEVVARLREHGARLLDVGKLGGTIVSLDAQRRRESQPSAAAQRRRESQPTEVRVQTLD